ncbi:MAG: stage II sporulation protein M [Eubacteriaceae bacterium]
MNKREIIKFISSNRRIVVLLIIMFIIGIVSGTLCVKSLSDVQKTELINYLSNFFKVLSNSEDINKNEMFLQLLYDNIKIYGLLFIFGIFSFGIFLIPILVMLKGFILGFTIGFILDELYLMGLLFSTVVIFPQNILYIMGLILSSSIGMITSYRKLQSKRKYALFTSHKRNFQQLIYYIVCILIGYVLTAIGCAFEAYVTPIFIIFFSNKLF